MPKVLVVDDAPGVHEMLRTLFSTLGVQDVYALSGPEALEAYRNNEIDVVLSDVRMEDMDGIALLRKLKKLDPKCVVILMTALDRKDDILAALKLGAFDFFVKPFLVNEFTSSLKRAFAERRRLLRDADGAGDEATADQAPAGNDQLGELRVVRQRMEEQREKLAMEEGILRRKLKQAEERSAALDEREASIRQLEKEFQNQNGACVSELEEVRRESERVKARELELNAQADAIAAREKELAERVSAHEAREKELEALQTELNERQSDLESQFAALEAAGALDASGSGGNISADLMDDEKFAERLEALQEKENLIMEREVFLEQSENAMFDKGQALQELETELDHRRDQLEAWEARLKESGPEGGISPEDAAEIEKIREEMEKRAEALSNRETEIRKRERSVQKAEALIRAREKYLEASESILFDREEA